MTRDVFKAIADPTRRIIINLIASESLNVSTIADTINMSRQAASKHIQILMECGMIKISQHGRERYCVAQLQKLYEVIGWVNSVQELRRGNLIPWEVCLPI